MPAVNDYKCENCDWFERDSITKITSCPECDGKVSVYFGNWSSIAIDPRHDERCTAQGTIRQFSALDDPLCCAQMGLAKDRGLASFAKVEPEKQKEFREKLIKDGDSPKLRREVLREYNKAIGGKYDLCE